MAMVDIHPDSASSTQVAFSPAVTSNLLSRDRACASPSLLELAANNDVPGLHHALLFGNRCVNQKDFWYCRSPNSGGSLAFMERSPIAIAALYGSIETISLLISLCRNCSADSQGSALAATGAGLTAGIGSDISSRALVNEPCGKDKTTALHCAASGGSLRAAEAVALLIANGANCEARDAFGLRPADVIRVPPRSPKLKITLQTLLAVGDMDSLLHGSGILPSPKVQGDHVRMNGQASPMLSLDLACPSDIPSPVSSHSIHDSPSTCSPSSSSPGGSDSSKEFSSVSTSVVAPSSAASLSPSSGSTSSLAKFAALNMKKEVTSIIDGRGDFSLIDGEKSTTLKEKLSLSVLLPEDLEEKTLAAPSSFSATSTRAATMSLLPKSASESGTNADGAESPNSPTALAGAAAFPSSSSLSAVNLPDVKNAAYMTDEFRMFSFKIKPCSRAYSHDWTECPFAHPGENARRRDPRKFHYSCVPCPDYKKGGGVCRKGDNCEYAHGVFECWLHPAQYRTRLCKDGVDCSRRVCFFAHAPDELRPIQSAYPQSFTAASPAGSTPVDALSASGLVTLAAGLGGAGLGVGGIGAAASLQQQALPSPRPVDFPPMSPSSVLMMSAFSSSTGSPPTPHASRNGPLLHVPPPTPSGGSFGAAPSLFFPPGSPLQLSGQFGNPNFNLQANLQQHLQQLQQKQLEVLSQMGVANSAAAAAGANRFGAGNNLSGANSAGIGCDANSAARVRVALAEADALLQQGFQMKQHKSPEELEADRLAAEFTHLSTQARIATAVAAVAAAAAAAANGSSAGGGNRQHGPGPLNLATPSSAAASRQAMDALAGSVMKKQEAEDFASASGLQMPPSLGVDKFYGLSLKDFMGSSQTGQAPHHSHVHPPLPPTLPSPSMRGAALGGAGGAGNFGMPQQFNTNLNSLRNSDVMKQLNALHQKQQLQQQQHPLGHSSPMGSLNKGGSSPSSFGYIGSGMGGGGALEPPSPTMIGPGVPRGFPSSPSPPPSYEFDDGGGLFSPSVARGRNLQDSIGAKAVGNRDHALPPSYPYSGSVPAAPPPSPFMSSANRAIGASAFQSPRITYFSGRNEGQFAGPNSIEGLGGEEGYMGGYSGSAQVEGGGTVGVGAANYSTTMIYTGDGPVGYSPPPPPASPSANQRMATQHGSSPSHSQGRYGFDYGLSGGGGVGGDARFGRGVFEQQDRGKTQSSEGDATWGSPSGAPDWGVAPLSSFRHAK